MTFEQGNEVVRRVARQRGFSEVRISRQEMFRLAIGVSEVTAATAGNEDLFAHAVGVLNHGHAASLLAGLYGAHQARSAGADNQGVKVCHEGMILPEYCRPVTW